MLSRLRRFFTEIPPKPVLLALIGVSVLARILLIPHDGGSMDYSFYIGPWMEKIRQMGFLNALKTNFTNYTPFFTYLMGLANLLPLPGVIAIKLVILPFELLTAWGGYRIIQRQLPGQNNLAFFVFSVLLVLPGIVVNTAWWTQCDAVYTAFAVWGLFWLLEKKHLRAFLFFGFSFSFKLQFAFIAPFLLVYVWREKICLLWFLVIPAVYAVLALPVLLAGRPVLDVLLIYLGQAGFDTDVYKNAPNLYVFIPKAVRNANIQALTVGGLALTALVTGAQMLMAFRLKSWNRAMFFRTALVLGAMVPYLAPRMHERYFYLTDVLALLTAVIEPKYRWQCLGIMTCSYLAVAGVTTIKPIGPAILAVIALPMGFFIFSLAAVTFHEIWAAQKTPQ